MQILQITTLPTLAKISFWVHQMNIEFHRSSICSTPRRNHTHPHLRDLPIMFFFLETLIFSLYLCLLGLAQVIPPPSCPTLPSLVSIGCPSLRSCPREVFSEPLTFMPSSPLKSCLFSWVSGLPTEFASSCRAGANSHNCVPPTSPPTHQVLAQDLEIQQPINICWMNKHICNGLKTKVLTPIIAHRLRS